MTATLQANENIVSFLGKRRRKSDWQRLFGELFPVLEDALRNTGVPVKHISCDSCSCNHAVRPEESDFVAVCQCEEEFCEDIPLSASDANAWEFNTIDFARKIGSSLSLSGKVICLGDGIIDLGKCQRHKDYKRVILCTCNDLQIVTSLAKIDGLKDVGCVLSFCTQEAISPSVKGLDAALLNGSHIRIDKTDGLVCRCDNACRLIESRKPLTLDHFDERMNNLAKTYAETKEDAQQARKELSSSLLATFAKADPTYIQYSLCVLAAGSGRKAAEKLRIPVSTFAKYLAEHKKDNPAHRAINSVLEKRSQAIGKKSIERFNEEWDEHQSAFDTGGDGLQELIETIMEGLERLVPNNAISVRKELLNLCEPYRQTSRHF